MLILRLPKTIEYALKILVCLTVFTGRPLSASAVAQRVRIPGSQAAKILNYLKLRGLTRSRRGPRGGYELRTNPEELYVQRVIELFQPVADEEAAGAPVDPVMQVWSDTSARFRREAEHLTIAELARRTARQFELSG